MTSVLLLQTLTQLQAAGQPTAPQISATTGPQTPPRAQEAVASSPPIPSPTQLACYLQYAETSLGVHYALSYKPALEMHGIGPDILPEVEDKFLSDLGILAGDTIRLKKGSIAWWNRPDAKRKRSNTSVSVPETQQPPVKKRVSYNKRYHDGGGYRFSGPPMRRDEDDDGIPVVRDHDLLYFCHTQKQWLPVPVGYLIDEDEEPQAD